MSDRRAALPQARIGEPVTVAAGLLGGLITGISFGFLLWHFF